MKTKLLDISIILKNKVIPILNTEMDVFVEYYFKQTYLPMYGIAQVPVVEKVNGFFQWTEKTELYKKENKITFCSDSSWDVSCNYFSVSESEINSSHTPEIAIVDLDKKLIKVFF